jgi:site-specific recombinase XerD
MVAGILRHEEVTHFLKPSVSLRPRTVLTMIYATGVRISEATPLQPAAIDS